MDASIGRTYKVIAARALSGLHSALIHAEQNGGEDLRPLELLRQELRGRYQGLETCEQVSRRSVEEIQYGIGDHPLAAEIEAEALETIRNGDEYERLYGH